MVGLDTLNLWLSADRVGQVDLLDTIPNFLDADTVVHQVRADGKVSVIGHLNNYRVTVYENGVSLNGSLPKSYIGDNVQTLTHNESALAVESLSNRLHLPLERAIVRRFDVADTLVMERPVKDYLGCLGNSHHYNRLEQPKSILWKNGKREKTIYDKGAECKRNKHPLSNNYENKHLLRYELRFISNLPKQFNVAEITPTLLYDENFYCNLRSQWIEEYKRITKIKKMTFDNPPASPTEFFDQILMIGIESIGGYMAIEELVNRLRKEGAFGQREHSSRIKRRIRGLMQNPSLVVPSELINELDKKVLSVEQPYH